VTAPVFLSEEEALQIITEELARSGVDLPEKNVAFEEIRIPRRYIQLKGDPRNEDWETEVVEAEDEAVTLCVDATVPDRHIAIEYVSVTGDRDLGGPTFGQGYSCSVVSYDLKETAQYLAQQVSKQGDGMYFGAFYDPVCRATPAVDWVSISKGQSRVQDRDEAARDAKANAEQLLRQQVKDFVDWLKAQGAI
jgi:hypothetical protein